MAFKKKSRGTSLTDEQLIALVEDEVEHLGAAQGLAEIAQATGVRDCFDTTPKEGFTVSGDRRKPVSNRDELVEIISGKILRDGVEDFHPEKVRALLSEALREAGLTDDQLSALAVDDIEYLMSAEGLAEIAQATGVRDWFDTTPKESFTVSGDGNEPVPNRHELVKIISGKILPDGVEGFHPQKVPVLVSEAVRETGLTDEQLSALAQAELTPIENLPSSVMSASWAIRDHLIEAAKGLGLELSGHRGSRPVLKAYIGTPAPIPEGHPAASRGGGEGKYVVGERTAALLADNLAATPKGRQNGR